MKEPFDTTAIEKDLHQCLTACTQFMAQNHGDEPFYGFAVDVNPFYFDFGVYYNTESKYQESLRNYLNGEFGDMYRDEKAKRWELRWSPGDWAFASAWPNPDELSDLMNPMSQWYDYGEKLGDDRDEHELETKLLGSMCRVLDKLQMDGAIDILPRTNDFRALVGDHDDGAIQIYSRYELYKKNGSILRISREELANFDVEAERDRVVAEFKE
jgi:hypothetical protein